MNRCSSTQRLSRSSPSPDRRRKPNEHAAISITSICLFQMRVTGA